MKKTGLTLLAALLGFGIFANAEYIRNPDAGVVYDTKTNLMWQDNDEVLVSFKKWREAIDYCEELSLAGYDDWRMPNFNEFDSLINVDRSMPAMAHVTEENSTVGGFYYIASSGTDTADDLYGKTYDKYWTSTTYMDANKTYAWTLQTRNGWNFIGEKVTNDDRIFVRCVRGHN